MNETRQCRTLELLSRTCCAAADTLKLKRKQPGAPIYLECSFCSKTEVTSPPRCAERAARDRATAIFVAIVRLPMFQELRRPRVFAMVALRRLVKHSPSPAFFDFETSFPGQWCLDCLKSSIRELRIAAGRTFGIYFANRANDSLDKSVVKRKRRNALEFLKTLSEKDVSYLHEACILAWGQAGRAIDGDELGLVLLGLVEYLGHRHTLVSAWAFSEMLNIADARGVTPRRLFQPFWPSLAFSVVKDLVSKPQTASKIAELLQLQGGVQELLRLLQQQALPWLVLNRKRDVIQKIAEARGETESCEPCLDTINLSSILALLLVQDVPNVAEFSMSLLRAASSQFDNSELVDLLRTDPLLMTLELFKLAADGDEARKARVSLKAWKRMLWIMTDRTQVEVALHTVSTLLTDGKDKKSKKFHITGRFIEQHALGLASKLSEVITDSLDLHPPAQERRRCLRAMEEMIRVCCSYVCVARPQVCKALQRTRQALTSKPSRYPLV